jgi:F0F1-type ATP synthase gamma subunit
MRIRATNNVAKITSVMKLVASSKLKAVEDALNQGRAFGVS